MLAEAGTLNLANNWAKTGWRNSHEGGGFGGSVTGGGTMITARRRDFGCIGSGLSFAADIARH